MEERLRLAVEFAQGVFHLHDNGNLWNDLSTRNALLFMTNGRPHLKLCDFGCAYVNGQMGDEMNAMNDDGVHETRYWVPPRGRERWRIPMIAKELFAMGSAIFEIKEWKVPYAEAGDNERQVTRWVYEGKLPSLSLENPATELISKCWAEGYSTSKGILDDLERLG
jgi:serine/threonine protein kinase